MSLLPSEDSTSKVTRSNQQTGLDIAHVLSVDDDANHMIKCQVVGPTGNTLVGAPKATPVIVPSHGDVALPSKGDLVILGWIKGQKPVILGTLYSRQDNPVLPSYSKDDRVIGHDATSAEVRIKEEGSVVITADSGDKIEVDTNDGSVRVNDGTNPVMYDLTTTKDGDGHVTDVSIVTSSKLKVPS